MANETLPARFQFQSMALPEIIEILPLKSPVSAAITVPGSKSITNRALILAALSNGTTRLEGALWSEDTQVMVECLRRLGFDVEIAEDPDESCNRTITVTGRNGLVPPGGTATAPLELFVGNAGTAARFLTALVCLGSGCYRLSGVPRMHERPQSALIHALRSLGYQIDSPDDRLPATVTGAGSKQAACNVDITASSQFASALLLCSTRGGWSVGIDGESEDNAPYVEMTRRLITSFPRNGGTFQIEPDASGGSYFQAAQWVQKHAWNDSRSIHVNHWPSSGWQVDARFPDLLPLNSGALADLSRETDLGDSIMTAIAIAPLNDRAVTYRELGRLRVQECERVAALRTELTRCGAIVVESGDSLIIEPSPALHGAEIETYHDHRMAMCFAVLGLITPGVRIKNPACVKKTFPNFFQKLAAAPPRGLGVEILHGLTGEALAPSDLFAA